MSKYTLVSNKSNVILNHKIDMFDLPLWIFNMSDQDYIDCSKAHYASGTSVLKDGTRVSVNIEAVGLALMFQHYKEEISSKNHIKLVSNSDFWIMNIFKRKVLVTWEMELIKQSESTCLFVNKIKAESNSWLLKILSIVSFGNFFAKKHNSEETTMFASKLVETFIK